MEVHIIISSKKFGWEANPFSMMPKIGLNLGLLFHSSFGKSQTPRLPNTQGALKRRKIALVSYNTFEVRQLTRSSTASAVSRGESTFDGRFGP